jgi:hypothetical protein
MQNQYISEWLSIPDLVIHQTFTVEAEELHIHASRWMKGKAVPYADPINR